MCYWNQIKFWHGHRGHSNYKEKDIYQKTWSNSSFVSIEWYQLTRNKSEKTRENMLERLENIQYKIDKR